LRIVERIIDVGDVGIYLVQVAGSGEEMEEQIARFRFALIVAFAALAIALAIGAAFQVRFGLRPLRQLQRELASIRRGEWDRIMGKYPSEVAPLADELNLLISANRDILERARTQVGNLAHALKTPLSVIVNEADAAPGQLAQKVQEQAQIMRDQISFYLDRARAAARGGALGAATPVAPSIEALLRAFSKIYGDKGMIFSGGADPQLRFLGERQDLEEMIGNLLDNAGKWAKSSVTIEVSVDGGEATRPTLRFTIDDDGPGLAPHLRAAATQRGRRLDETKPGSGLGLSIVVDLAAAYGGSLRLDDSPNGGLRAELLLPGF
jgi:signal transduction histidine kinase